MHVTRPVLETVYERPGIKQRGVVLLIALIMLVAMSLAGIALVRSVYTTNIIAGNMAFQQAAVHSSDIGIETAIKWLEDNNTGITLHSDIPSSGYASSWSDPAPGQSWEEYWTEVLPPEQIKTLDPDDSGNTVSYTIQRLCKGANRAPTSTGAFCATAPSNAATASGSSKGSGVIALEYNSQVYYRITSRVTGPQNTVSFVQVVVAI